MRQLAIVMLALLLLTSIATANTAPQAPAVRSETSIPKLLRMLREPNWERRTEGSLALAALGPDALPALAKAQADASTSEIDGYRSLIGASRGRIAMRSSEAIPQLIDDLSESDFGHWTCVALSLTGDDALPALAQVLATGDAKAQEHGIDAIGSHRASAASLAPLLASILTDPARAPRVRWRAAVALPLIGPLGDAEISALRRGLHDADLNTRFQCVWALARQRERGTEGLLEAITIEELRDHASARLALLSKVRVDSIVAAVNSAPGTPTLALLLRVLAVRPERSPVIEDLLVAHLSHRDPLVRFEALVGAVRHDLDGQRTLERLRVALADGDVLVRAIAAAAALDLGESTCVELRSDLVGALTLPWPETAEPNAWKTVVQSLIEAGPLSVAQVSSIVDAALHTDDDRWSAAVLALGASKETARAEALRRLAPDGELAERPRLVVLLGALGECATRDLLELSKSQHDGVRRTAVRCLGLAGIGTPEVLARLKSACDDPQELSSALQALYWIGDDADEMRLALLRRVDKLRPTDRAHLLRAAVHMQADEPAVANVTLERARAAESADELVTALEAMPLLEALPERRVEFVFQLLRRLEADSLKQDLKDRKTQVPVWMIKARPLIVTGGFLALVKMEHASEPAIELAGKYLDDPHPLLRLGALTMLEHHGEKSARFAVTLVRLSQSEEPQLAALCLRLLASLGPRASVTATTIASNACGQRSYVGFSAAIALARMGADARAALPYLCVMALREEWVDAGWWQEEKEGGIGVGLWQASETGPGNGSVRREALRGIEQITWTYPEDAPLVRATLERITSDPDAAIAKAASQLLDTLPR